MLHDLAERPSGQAVLPVLMAGAAALLLAWPAFYNGFPFFSADVAAYPQPAEAIWPRADFYRLLVPRSHASAMLWSLVLVQSAIAAHLLYLIARVTCGSVHAGGYFALVTALAFGSSLPWFTSLVAPDFLLGVAVLGTFLLALTPDRLGRAERLFIFILTAAAIAAHSSHLPVAAGVLIVAVILKFVLGSPSGSRLIGGALVAGPLLLAVAAHLAASGHAARGPAVPSLSPITLLGRMVEDGTAVSYLREACPQRRYALCDYLDELPGTSAALLWEDGTAMEKAGGARLRDEARAIVAGTLAADPLGQFGRGVVSAARQFVTFEADDWLTPGSSARRSPPAGRELSGAAEAYSGSRQAMRALPTSIITLWHTFSALFGMTASAFLFAEYCRRGDREMIALFLVILTALVVNAAVTGGLSVVHGRHQSRLAWLAILYAATAAHHFYLCNAAESRREA